MLDSKKDYAAGWYQMDAQTVMINEVDIARYVRLGLQCCINRKCQMLNAISDEGALPQFIFTRHDGIAQPVGSVVSCLLWLLWKTSQI